MPDPSLLSRAGSGQDRSLRILVLTAAMGEGHLAAARTLSDDLVRDESAEVVVCDALRAMNRLLRRTMIDAYRWQLAAAPWMFGTLFGSLIRSGLLLAICRRSLAILGSRSVLRLVRRYEPDVVVSTWPPTTLILGPLRSRGRVRVPVCASITDFAGLELWSDRGIDLHLVMHESLVPTVERVAGVGSARRVAPLVAQEFLAPRAPQEARRALGLPESGRIVVVSGGGWGIGDLDGAVNIALGIEGVFVVCLAGRNEDAMRTLDQQFSSNSRVLVLGFTERMNDLLAAADVLVHSTGGVTCLEALARGCPIVAYGAPSGHAPLLARKMGELGLLRNAVSKRELYAALQVALTSASGVTLRHHLDAAGAILSVPERVVAPFRARVARPAALAAVALVGALATFSSDLAFPLVAEALEFRHVSHFETRSNAVALIVRTDESSLPGALQTLEALRVHASVALVTSSRRADSAVLRSARLATLPALAAGEFTSWFETRRQLGDQNRPPRKEKAFLYLAPREGFTAGQYLLARDLGGVPVEAAHTIRVGSEDLGGVHRGDVIVVELPATRSGASELLVRAVVKLREAGFRVSSLSALAAGSRSE